MRNNYGYNVMLIVWSNYCVILLDFTGFLLLCKVYPYFVLPTFGAVVTWWMFMWLVSLDTCTWGSFASHPLPLLSNSILSGMTAIGRASSQHAWVIWLRLLAPLSDVSSRRSRWNFLISGERKSSGRCARKTARWRRTPSLLGVPEGTFRYLSVIPGTRLGLLREEGKNCWLSLSV